MNSNFYNYTPYNYNRNIYAFVNGIEGAKAYPMAPNQVVMLMDSDSPLCFKKQSDNTGKASLQCFKLVEISEEELRGIIPSSNETNALQEQISTLNSKIEELTKAFKSLKKEGKENG